MERIDNPQNNDYLPKHIGFFLSSMKEVKNRQSKTGRRALPTTGTQAPSSSLLCHPRNIAESSWFRV